MKTKTARDVIGLVRARAEGSVFISIARAALSQIGVGAAALLLARTPFTGGLYPFGLAAVIGASDRFAIAALVGFVASHWVGAAAVGNTAYIAAAGVVAALRWILAGVSRSRYRKSSYLPSLVAGLLTAGFIELAVLALTGAFDFASAARAVAGLCVTGAFSYFYTVSFGALRSRERVAEFTSAQKACAALALASVLMSLAPLTIGAFSLGRILCFCCALFAAYSLETPIDLVALGAAACAMALSNPDYVFASAGLCVAGSLASLFKRSSRAAVCGVFVLAAALPCAAAGSYIAAMTCVAEVFISGIVFLALRVSSPSDARDDFVNDSMKGASAALSMKLERISSSLTDVASLLDKTVEIKNTRCDTEKLYRHVAETVCKGCAQMTPCWVKNYGDTSEGFFKLTPTLLARSRVTPGDFTELFRERCINLDKVTAEINRGYGRYLDYVRKIENTQLYKSMLKKQFEAVCEMLEAARGELCAFRRLDEAKSSRAYDCAARLRLGVESAGFIYDASGRPRVTVTLSQPPTEVMIKRLTMGLSMIAARELGEPEKQLKGGGAVLSYSERPKYAVSTAIRQRPAQEGVCGDVCAVLTDLSGGVHAIVSDGMGTGESAARDAAVCCAFLSRLLESGFAIKRAAELANSALALRENDEAASTLDVASFNVYSGELRVFKAGAAPSFALSGARVLRLDGRTLPVGILERVLCEERTLTLGDGDIFVMASDGATGGTCGYIEQTLKVMYRSTAEEICAELERRALAVGEPRDDLTFVVAKVSSCAAAERR